MNNNKAFAAWVLLVIGGSASLMLCLVLAGVATLPPLATIVEHAAMGLCVRAAYKWFGGWDWADWSIAGDATGVAIADDLHAEPGMTAGAMG